LKKKIRKSGDKSGKINGSEDTETMKGLSRSPGAAKRESQILLPEILQTVDTESEGSDDDKNSFIS